MTDLQRSLQLSLSGAYTVERELGGGGMSRVFVARDESLGRPVVVKVLSPDLAEGISAERFAREIHLAAGLQQANIVPVLSAGAMQAGEDLPYYVMPFVEGLSLRARLEQAAGGGRIPLREAVRILGDIARALEYAHARGIVHRDVKPENVLLSGGTAVVTDFGIAKALAASRTKAPGGTLTVVGTSIGTPAYMAPEQAVGGDVDQRADIYAWGLIAYELLAGHHPFASATTAQQLIRAHIAERPPSFAKHAQVPPALAALVMRTLAKEPAERPASARELLDALDAVPLERTSRRGAWMATIAAAMLVAAVGLYAMRARGTASSSSNISSVAVLPLENAGGDSKDEYLADGITDELAYALTGLPSLQVAGRSSSYAFKGKHATPAEIGKALHVDAVIEGTVRRSGDRLRLTAQLTNTSDGRVRWADRFEQRETEVFQVQDAFTKEIVAALRSALSGRSQSAEGSRAEPSRGTDDPAAYDVYLKARFFWAKRGASNLARADSFYADAIARDPKFARAYAGRSLVRSVLPFYAAVPVDSVVALAITDARRALELDPALAAGHLALARAHTDMLRTRAAADEYQKALALDPDDAEAHHWYAGVLVGVGRVDDGIAEGRRAHQIDPLSAVTSADLADELRAAGRFDDATAAARDALAVDSAFTVAMRELALSYALRGLPDSAVAVVEAAARGGTPVDAAHAAFVYAAANRWSDAERVRREFQARRRRGESSPIAAVLALVFGDREAALTELERSVAAHDLIPFSRIPNCDPVFAPLREEPRFQALMARSEMAACPVPATWPIRER